MKSTIGHHHPGMEWHKKASLHGINFHAARLEFLFPFWILDADGFQ